MFETCLGKNLTLMKWTNKKLKGGVGSKPRFSKTAVLVRGKSGVCLTGSHASLLLELKGGEGKGESQTP